MPDILPSDQHGVLGHVDDALIFHSIVAQLAEPETKVAEMSHATSQDVASLMT